MTVWWISFSIEFFLLRRWGERNSSTGSRRGTGELTWRWRTMRLSEWVFNKRANFLSCEDNGWRGGGQCEHSNPIQNLNNASDNDTMWHAAHDKTTLPPRSCWLSPRPRLVSIASGGPAVYFSNGVLSLSPTPLHATGRKSTWDAEWWWTSIDFIWWWMTRTKP